MGHTKVISECIGKSKVISPYETQCTQKCNLKCKNLNHENCVHRALKTISGKIYLVLRLLTHRATKSSGCNFWFKPNSLFKHTERTVSIFVQSFKLGHVEPIWRTPLPYRFKFFLFLYLTGINYTWLTINHFTIIKQTDYFHLTISIKQAYTLSDHLITQFTANHFHNFAKTLKSCQRHHEIVFGYRVYTYSKCPTRGVRWTTSWG